MANILQYGAESVWGVDAPSSMTGVYVTNQNFSTTPAKSELKDSMGRVVGVTYYDQTIQFTEDVTLLAGSSTSPRATVVSAGGLLASLSVPDKMFNCSITGATQDTGVVDSVSTTEGNESDMTSSVQGTVYGWNPCA